MIFLILAAGKGTRMNSLGVPKPLIPIGNIPMIVRLLQTLEKLTNQKKIYLMVETGKEDLFQREITRYLGYCPFLVLQKKEDGYGTGAALQSFVKQVSIDSEDNVFILNSDTPFIEKDTLEQMLFKKYIYQYDLLIGSGFLKDPTGYGRIFKEENGNICIIEEKELRGRDASHVNGGLYLVSPELLQRANEIQVSSELGEKKITDLVQLANHVGIYSDMKSFELFNINTPLDKNFAEFFLSTSK